MARQPVHGISSCSHLPVETEDGATAAEVAGQAEEERTTELGVCAKAAVGKMAMRRWASWDLELQLRGRHTHIWDNFTQRSFLGQAIQWAELRTMLTPAAIHIAKTVNSTPVAWRTKHFV